MAPLCPKFFVMCYNVIQVWEHCSLFLESTAIQRLAKTMGLVGFQSLPVLCVGVQTDGRVGVGIKDGEREAFYLLSFFANFYDL